MNKENITNLLLDTKENPPLPEFVSMQPNMNIHHALDFATDLSHKLNMHIEYLLNQYMTDINTDKLDIRMPCGGKYEYYLNDKLIFIVMIDHDGYKILTKDD